MPQGAQQQREDLEPSLTSQLQAGGGNRKVLKQEAFLPHCLFPTALTTPAGKGRYVASSTTGSETLSGWGHQRPHTLKDWRAPVATVGVQNESPQNAPQWYVDYFELKASETLQAQDKLLSPT